MLFIVILLVVGLLLGIGGVLSNLNIVKVYFILDIILL